jgi:hypothetical protein
MTLIPHSLKEALFIVVSVFAITILSVGTSNGIAIFVFSQRIYKCALLAFILLKPNVNDSILKGITDGLMVALAAILVLSHSLGAP